MTDKERIQTEIDAIRLQIEQLRQDARDRGFKPGQWYSNKDSWNNLNNAKIDFLVNQYHRLMNQLQYDNMDMD